ncbi:MAG: SusE domain-containing protein [Bacteroidaceae bacterium]|nr:SusE domain-containing protein [Bacteroidaceae bacterium]
MLVCAGFATLAACTDDRDSNPTLIQPTEFKLNDPACGKTLVVLSESQAIQFSWSQPKFTANNAPINATYEIHVSPTGTFNHTVDEAKEDESIVADYAVLDETYLTCTADIPASSIDKALVQICKWQKDADVPAIQNIYIRVNAFVKEGTKKLNEIISNTVVATVSPYYIELKPAEPIMWFLVGNDFGDGSWGDKNAIGTGSFPMFKVYGETYDEKTGAGVVTYLNYFSPEGWKIQPSNFDWYYGFMGTGSANSAVYRNGDTHDSGNIWCSPAGIYKVSVTTPSYDCKIEAYTEGEPTVYPSISIAGSFNSWSDTEMTPVSKAANNHVWCYVADFTALPEPGTQQFKFKTTGSWDTNWGFGKEDGEVNLVGVGTPGGKNLGLEPGKWCIMFNDITGEFSIIELQ